MGDKDISARYVKKVFKRRNNHKEINVESGTTTSGESNLSNNSQESSKKYPLYPKNAHVL